MFFTNDLFYRPVFTRKMVILLEKNIYREQNLDIFLFLIKIPNQNRKPVSKVLLFRPTYQQTLQFWTQKYQYYLFSWCFRDNFVQMVKFIAFRVQTMAPLWLGHNFSLLYCPSTWINGNFSVYGLKFQPCGYFSDKMTIFLTPAYKKGHLWKTWTGSKKLIKGKSLGR